MSARIPTFSSSILAIPRHLQKNRRFQTSTAASLNIRTAPSTNVARQFSHSSRLNYPRKDSQDKDSINTEATEYSKSATDDEGARQEDAAFNPDVTDPQQQKDIAGKNRGDVNNPLEVSPANPEVSKPRGDTEGGAENSSASSEASSGRQRSSGGGSPNKGSKVA